MASQDERMLILKMIDEGKISADEGARLLAAIRPTGSEINDHDASTVTEMTTDKAAEVKAAAKAAAKDSDDPQEDERGSKRQGDSKGSTPHSNSMRINVKNVDLNEDDSLTTGYGAAKNLRVRISDPDSNEDTVNVNVPLKIVEFGLQFLPDTNNSRLESIREAVNNGKTGSVISIKDDGDATRVEVSLE